MRGEKEWATGQPKMPTIFVAPEISTGELFMEGNLDNVNL